jgi:2,4-dienoyl-CoA reductase-like NADH-dependent reductase (Old Yellow Enzyme family)
MRFAVEIVRRIREACGPDFIIIYRLSMLDLVDDGGCLGRCGRAGEGGESCRRDDHQHRHRLARGAHSHHRHLGAAWRSSPASPRA